MERKRGFFLAGVALPILATAVYFFTAFKLAVLQVPWYLPVASTLGLGLVVLALRRKRSVPRWIGLAVVVLATILTWAAVLGFMLPDYDGPVAVGKPFPAFSARMALGDAVSRENLVGGQPSVLVFYRGWW